MEQNQRSQQENTQNQQTSDNLNTAAGLRAQTERLSDDSSGSGRSYDYGSENSTEEDLNEQLGRNSNQQNASNPINTPGASSDNPAGPDSATK